jgi:hypothetical protein
MNAVLNYAILAVKRMQRFVALNARYAYATNAIYK